MSATEPMDGLRFKMPAESDPHLRTFMQWPSDWQIYGSHADLRAAQDDIVAIASAIAAFEPVVMLTDPAAESDVHSRLNNVVDLWALPVQDLWCRDSGPTFVVGEDGTSAIVDLNFNGWGGKQAVPKDGRIASRVSERLGIRLIDSGLIGEGGGLEADGDGTLLAHLSSWVNPNRNRMAAEEVAERLTRALGAEKMIWAPGLAGHDITDYHIDALARFVRPGHVVIQLPKHRTESDPWSNAAWRTYDTLREARDARGRSLEITVIQDPDRSRIRSREDDFVASYVNYYVCNGGVVMSAFGDDGADAKAFETIAALHPERQTVALQADALGAFGGGIHCATQQQPATA